MKNLAPLLIYKPPVDDLPYGYNLVLPDGSNEVRYTGKDKHGNKTFVWRHGPYTEDICVPESGGHCAVYSDTGRIMGDLGYDILDEFYKAVRSLDADED